MPTDGLPPEGEVRQLAPYIPIWSAILWKPVSARLESFDQKVTKAYQPGADGGGFEIELAQAGPTSFDAWFADAEGEEWGAYFVLIERR